MRAGVSLVESVEHAGRCAMCLDRMVRVAANVLCCRGCERSVLG